MSAVRAASSSGTALDTGEEMRARLGRFPSVSEVAMATGMTAEEVTEARLAVGASRLASLDAPIATRDEADDSHLGDMLGCDDEGLQANGTARCPAGGPFLQSAHCSCESESRRPCSAGVCLELF